MVTHLSAEQRQLALRLRARGLSLRQIAPQVGCSHELVRIIARGGSTQPQRRAGPWVPGPGRLTLADREEISLGLQADETFAVIAVQPGKAASTVSREVAGNGGRTGYRAWRAHQRARERARRPKVPKLACPRLAAQVTGWLEAWWSPQEISARLRIEFAVHRIQSASYLTATRLTGWMSGARASRSADTSASAAGIWPLMCAVRASLVAKVSKMP